MFCWLVKCNYIVRMILICYDQSSFSNDLWPVGHFRLLGSLTRCCTGFGEFLYQPDWLDMEDAERAVTFFYHLSLCALNTSLVSGAMAERSPSVPSKPPQGELQDLPGVLGVQRDNLCHPRFMALQPGRLAEATWRH